MCNAEREALNVRRDVCRKLWLGNNRLRTLPRTMMHLTGLQQLFLEGNQLTQLPAELSQLRNLQRITVEDNPLKVVDDGLKKFLAPEMPSASA